jgi:hypothetical protein
MPQYVLLLRDQPSQGSPPSPAEMQEIIGRYKAWSQKLAAQGHMRGGQKLRDGVGRVMNGASVLDGPYAETKEVMGGFFLLEASGFDEAVELTRDCPHLDYGSIEVREVEPTD